MKAIALACPLVGVLLLGFAGLVSAQATTSEVHDEEARGLYAAGEAAFAAGRFEEALGYFQRSFELSGRSELLFNVGQAADRSRHDEIALDAFRRYLAANPDVPNRAEITGRIRILEAAVARARSAPPPAAMAPIDDGPPPAPAAERDPLPPSRPDADTTPESADVAAALDERPAEVATTAPHREEATARADATGPDVGGIALTSAGGVLAVAGAILLAVGVPDTNAVSSPRFGESFDAARDRQGTGIALAVSGGIGLGVGLGLAVAGIIVLASAGSGDGSPRASADGLAWSF